jgi:two-component system, OmpR family, response regulator TctD
MRILLIEDSPDIADAIATKFRREGHMVELAEDGNLGEDFALAGGFDVIILDINLPGKDGFALLASIRQRKMTTPVLVITARNQVADKVSLLDLGADDYIVKPFDLTELAARTRALVRRGLGAAQSVLSVGRLTVDIAKRSAQMDNQILDLGRREFDMLEALMANAGGAVNKEHIMLRLFGHDEQGSLNAIELLVSRLRKKLEGGDVEIVTQRGVGYVLREKA